MRQYRSTPEMKKRILEAAKKLFYDQGYTDTYLEQIAKDCGISKQLITYHFQTKSNLANEVLKDYLKELKNTIIEKIYFNLGEYNVRYSTAVDFQLMLRMYRDDAKAYRFYKERLNGNFDDIFSNPTLNLYKLHNRQYKLNINNDMDEITMITYAAFASNEALITAYFSGKINCTFEQFSDYTTALQFRLMRVDEKEIDKILTESKKIIDKLDYSFGPYFKIL